MEQHNVMYFLNEELEEINSALIKNNELIKNIITEETEKECFNEYQNILDRFTRLIAVIINRLESLHFKNRYFKEGLLDFFLRNKEYFTQWKNKSVGLQLFIRESVSEKDIINLNDQALDFKVDILKINSSQIQILFVSISEICKKLKEILGDYIERINELNSQSDKVKGFYSKYCSDRQKDTEKRQEIKEEEKIEEREETQEQEEEEEEEEGTERRTEELKTIIDRMERYYKEVYKEEDTTYEDIVKQINDITNQFKELSYSLLPNLNLCLKGVEIENSDLRWNLAEFVYPRTVNGKYINEREWMFLNTKEWEYRCEYYREKEEEY